VRDARGLEVSGASGETIAVIDRFTDDFMGVRDAAGDILAVAEKSEGCALIQAYAAALYLYAQTESAAATARSLLVRARATWVHMTPRERLFVLALEAWTARDHARAIALLEALAVDWPADIIAAKIAEFLLFEAPDFPRHLRFMESVAPAQGERASFLAMHAFALELNGRYVEAERLANRAIEIERATPWAHHALGHIHLNRGDLDRGLRVLGELAGTWGAHSRALATHNYWHVAVLHLARLDFDAALALYASEIRGRTPGDVFEITDAASLLWRIELAGGETGERWGEIAPHAAALAGEPVFPFLSAHYFYALGRAGRLAEASEALTRLENAVDKRPGGERLLWRRVGLPLVQGCLAAARGAHPAAAETLVPILADVGAVGGSDAQNDLFRQTAIVALLKARRRSEARGLVEARLAGRKPTPLEASWLAQA
jgi:tetratricopeptide (TPR) repeat protein